MAKASKGKSHKQHKSKHRKSVEYKLWKYAALGQSSKLCRTLAKQTELDVNFFDAQGNTALHEASRAGHCDIVTALLSHGADARAEDVHGNTPAHLAASKGHLAILTALLQSEHAPDVEATNADGVSIQQLAAAAMTDSSGSDRPTSSDAQQAKRARHTYSETDAIAADASENEEAQWQARLREESGAELRGADEDDWDSYGGFCEQPNFAQPQAEDEDAFARRIWQEMERRKRQQTDGAAAACDLFAAEREAAMAREQASFDAAQRSRRILEEEKAKDRAWREAVQKGDLGTRRAKYEVQWHAFASADKSRDIQYSDVPWLVEDLTEDKAQLTAFVLYGAISVEERRKRSRAELMRWHPDKFTAKFGARLIAKDRQQILHKVNAMSQLLNSIANDIA